MAAAVAMHSALTSSSGGGGGGVTARSASHRFARQQNLILGSRSAVPRSRDRRSTPVVSTSRTTTVIPTTGIEIEGALNGILEELGIGDRGGEAQVDAGGGDGGNKANGRGGGGGGGGGGGDENGWSGSSDPSGDDPSSSSSSGNFLFGLWEAFARGWRSRVRSDPQFPFKVLTEEVIGVGACVVGDMASRPNFGLDELDFVFSTVVVGSILNFTLMYMLAPTSAGADISRLPSVFASCPPGHMFEPGAYTLLDRFGTLVYKGVAFAGAGFLAGLVGTAVSKVLLDARKRVDPSFQLQNKPPPTLLNAATWALHMGVSSNLRYQALNGLEYFAAGVLSPAVFKTSVFAVRAANNVLGGTSFVTLARLTGSQRAEEAAAVAEKKIEGEEDEACKNKEGVVCEKSSGSEIQARETTV